MDIPRTMHLFAGAGGGILADLLLGHRPVCAVEIEPYCRQVLLQRQRDGILPRFPIWDDVCTFDGTEWRGKVDVVCGGFPCQDISAGGKGAGIAGKRSGLWGEMARIIGEVRPRYTFIENSPLLASRGLSRVLCDLAQMGYDARWGVLGTSTVGGHSKRSRLWVVASTDNQERGRKLRGFRALQKGHEAWQICPPFNQPEPLRVADGVANRLDRLNACGNGQVPAVASLAWRILTKVNEE